MADLLPGVRSHVATTSRLRTHYLEAGPEDGRPVVLVHGNLSSARFFEHLLTRAAGEHRFIAPDMRGFGDSEALPLDATRGLDDWADDLHALLAELDATDRPHLAGWSTGGVAIVAYARRHPVASLTFIDPAPPYGYGAVLRDGTPCYPDCAGSGGGLANPDFVARLRGGDRSDESPFSPRNVMNTSYWAPTHREPPEREDLLVDELLKSNVGDEGYPGDATPSDNWPGAAPGSTGILNALSPKYCRWDDIVELADRPPVLWTHGTEDIVVADGSAWEIGMLGSLGHVPGWPGADVVPPQPMVSQIRDVLERYAEAGGLVRTELFTGSGHGPHLDAADRWWAVFTGFLADVEAGAAA